MRTDMYEEDERLLRVINDRKNENDGLQRSGMKLRQLVQRKS
jgi:hypothetical protein